jgi:hypothetical protein
MLVCEECGCRSESEANGWRSYLTDEEDAPTKVVNYCPDCARREFGDDDGASRR